MAKSTHRIPIPQAQAFVVYHEIWDNARTNQFMLTGSVMHMHALWSARRPVPLGKRRKGECEPKSAAVKR